MITYSNFGINGRLGNQMFQYAALLAAAKRLNTECVLPARIDKNASKFETINDLIEFNVKDLEETKCFKFVHPDEYNKYYLKHFTKYYREPTFCFDPNFLNIDDGTNIIGYFQSEKYFKQYRKEIINIFSLKNPGEKFYYYQKFINANKPTSIHVRRGDYVNKKNFHNSLADTLYYIYAVEKIKSIDSNRKFLVFSDDIEFCKNYFQNYFEEYVDDFFYVTDTSGPEEIKLQSFCRDNIIANSSFSWWGAWLNENKENKVIAPAKWFGPDGPKDTQDVYCDGWIKI
jgi:hypothetical protein